MASAAANDVDLAVDRSGVGVIARHRHRPAALPLVRRRVKNLVGGENQRWTEEREVWILGICHRGCAADHVDLAADFNGYRSAAFGR